MQRQGINIYRNTNGVEKIELDADGLKKVTLNNGEVIEGVECVLMAIGRSPNVEPLNLPASGVDQNKKGYIVTDEYSKTSAD
eukprot:scaffold2902_cov154-Chaetoceros_neogracile.AAC.1